MGPAVSISNATGATSINWLSAFTRCPCRRRRSIRLQSPQVSSRSSREGCSWPRASVVPVFLVGLVIAAIIVPKEHHAFFDVMKYVAAPIEVGLVLFIIYRVRGAIQKARSRESVDEIAAIEAVASELVPHPRVSRILASEVSVLYLGIISWFSKRKPAQVPSFTVHRTCGYAAVFGVICFAMIVEVFGLHLLLSLWSATAAWILTGLSLYGLLWFVADFRAMTHHPVRLTSSGLLIQFGLRWRVELPYSQIREATAWTAQHPTDLRLSPWGDPMIWIRLRQPHIARGLYGLEKRISTAALTVDDPKRFLEALRGHTSTRPK